MAEKPMPIVQCPACQAGNEAGPRCRRCRADLEILFRLERQRRRLLASAVENLRSGAWSAALEAAQAAAAIRADLDSTRVQAAAALMQRSFDAFRALLTRSTEAAPQDRRR
jgi:hypothetical protein